MIMNESQLNYIIRNYGSVERFELITNQRRNGELESDDESIFNDGYCCHEMAVSSHEPEYGESESIVMNHSAGNCAAPKQFELNDSDRLHSAVRAMIAGNDVDVVRKPVDYVLDVMDHYEHPTGVDPDLDCRTAPRAMTPMAWKSRFLAADSVRARSARSSIVRIDNRRCRGTGGRVSGHFGRIKSHACINAWDPI